MLSDCQTFSVIYNLSRIIQMDAWQREKQRIKLKKSAPCDKSVWSHLISLDCSMNDTYSLACRNRICAGVYGAVVPVIATVGAVGNCISFTVLLQKSLRNVVTCCLAVLAAVDAILITASALAFAPFALCTTCTQACRVMTQVTHVCYPVVIAMHTASAWLCVLISGERFLAVCYPLMVKSVCTPKRTVIAVVGILFAAVSYSIVTLFEIQYHGFCHLNETEMRQNPLYQKIYKFGLSFTLKLILPMIVLGFLNIGIITSLRRSRSFSKPARRRSSRHPTEKQMPLTMISLIIVAIFFITNIVPFVVTILEIKEEGMLGILPYLVPVSNLLVVTNSSLNPFIYTIVGCQFRKVVKETFCPFLRSEPPSIVGSEVIGFASFDSTANSRLHRGSRALSTPNCENHPGGAADGNRSYPPRIP